MTDVSEVERVRGWMPAGSGQVEVSGAHLGSERVPGGRGDDQFRSLAESGHGLLAVQALAAWWGHHTFRDGANRGTAVWFRLDWKPA